MSVDRRSLLWILAALLGIVASAAVAWSASQLATERIGLGSEPLSVVSNLAPRMHAPVGRAAAHQGEHRAKATLAAKSTVLPVTPQAPVAPVAGAAAPPAAVLQPAQPATSPTSGRSASGIAKPSGDSGGGGGSDGGGSAGSASQRDD